MVRLTVLLLLAILSSFHSNSQLVSKNYLIGVWKSIDSVTGEKTIADFENDSVLVFEKNRRKSRWQYSVIMHDSIISLGYEIITEKATLSNEGILIIENNDCFFWFNPIAWGDYTKYLTQSYRVQHPLEYSEWLKENRQVYYRVQIK